MLKNPAFAITAVSLYLLVYVVLAQLQFSASVLVSIFSFSPVIVIWMVYTVIRFGSYSGKELQDGEEWGYEDKKKEDLQIF